MTMNFAGWNEVQKKITLEPETECTVTPRTMLLNIDWDEHRVQEALGQERYKYMEALSEWNEAEREKRKAQFDAVLLDELGRVIVEVCNTRRKYDPRVVTNFSEPKLIIFQNFITEERIYKVSLIIGKTKTAIWLRDEDLGDAKAMLKKFNRAGAEFLSNKSSERKNLMLQLWAILVKNAKIVRVADRPGWMIADDKMVFVDEEVLTWETLMKKK